VEILTLDNIKHGLSDDDKIKISQIKGMLLKNDSTKSINDDKYQITVINPYKFILKGIDANNYED